jgi:hypothetical protein
VAGVDGGFAIERTAAIDLLLSVAVGVEGLTDQTTLWNSTQYEWWSWADKHDPDAERLARGVMIAQELKILAGAQHSLLILDGSHLTLVIQLNSALSAPSEIVRSLAAAVWEKLKTVESLSRVCRAGNLIAMPKYDSSRTITDLLGDAMGEHIPGDDKYIMGLLLDAGEYIDPRQVPTDPWSKLHFSGQDRAGEKLAASLEEAIEPLRDRRIQYTYFKPDQLSTAFRIEVKADDHADMDLVCSTIAGQMTGPFVREPYPQYLADVMAKSVGLGLSALQSAVQIALSGIGRPELAELLIHSYRTEGV